MTKKVKKTFEYHTVTYDGTQRTGDGSADGERSGRI